MKRRHATLLVLLGALVLLAAAAVVVAWRIRVAEQTQRPSTEASAQFVTVLSVQQSELRSVELSSAAGVLVLEQSDGVWRLARPAVLSVKPGPLNDLMYSLANLVSERVVDEDPASLVPYGLDRPAVTVRATLANGEVRVLYLGNRTPAADSYYLMAEGDPRVFTVRQHHGDYFRYGVGDFWAGQRTPIDGANVVALRIERDGAPRLEIRRTEELYRADVEFRGTTLSVVHPWADAPKPVDLTYLTTFVTSFARLGAEVAVDVAPRDLAPYGLDRPSRALLVVDGAGNQLDVRVGTPRAGEIYLQFRDDPTVYQGDPDLLAILDVDPLDFVNRYAAILRLDDVDTLTITAGETTHRLEIRRKTPRSEEGAQWLVDGKAVPAQAFKDFYTFVVSLQVDAFQENPAAGAPALTLTYGLNRDGGPFVVAFIPHSPEFYAVTKNGRGDMLVNRQQVRALLARLEELAASARS